MRRPCSGLVMRAGFAKVILVASIAAFSLVPPAYADATKFGGPQLNYPGGIAVQADGSVLATDQSKGHLLHYTHDGTYIGSVGTVGSGTSPIQFTSPSSIAVDPTGNVLVADGSRVDVLAPDLTYLRSIPSSAIQVTADAGAIYVLSTSPGTFVLSKYSNDANLTLEGTHVIIDGSGDDQMDVSRYDSAQMAVAANGDVLIVDMTNQRVVTYDSSLAFVRSWSLGHLASGIAIGHSAGVDQVYVGGWTSGASIVSLVERRDVLGHLEGVFQTKGISPPPTFFGPRALATDRSGDVYATDSNGLRVVRITPTPSVAFTATPASGLTSQSVTFDGTASTVPFWSISRFEWDLDGSGLFAIDGGSLPTVGKRFDLPGTYPISLKVATTNGQTGTTVMNYTVGPSQAAFVGPSKTPTGSGVTFDATASVIPYSSVTDYAWDFDGSGSYAVDGGATPTISHAFASPGTYSVQLRITRSGGRVDLANGTIVATPAPPPGPVGVSLNNGDFATNIPHVTINAIWPKGADQAMISNDGGFGLNGGSTTLPLAAKLPWTLTRTGPDRLPKTIFLRFLGAGIDLQNFTDDIILDQTPPTLRAARLVAAGSGVRAPASASRAELKLRSYRIKVTAQDKIAGVCAIAASSRKSGGTRISIKNCHRRGTLRLAKVVTIKAAKQPKYVRVLNSAGTWSRWLRLGSHK